MENIWNCDLPSYKGVNNVTFPTVDLPWSQIITNADRWNLTIIKHNVRTLATYPLKKECEHFNRPCFIFEAWCKVLKNVFFLRNSYVLLPP